MALREINATLKQALIDNVPFTYAHLLKFERPTKVAQYLGVASTDSKNYTYITDAPYDIVFDDGDGNGPKVYRANKLVKAGSVNETIKAKASSISIVLDSSTLDSQAIEPRFITVSTTEGGTGTLNATGVTNFVELGFREGDKATIRSSNSSFDGVSVIIRTFINEGNGFTYTAATTMPEISLSASADVTSIDLVSEELTALTTAKEVTSYTSYINREVYVHKVFIATEFTTLSNGDTISAGSIIGGANNSPGSVQGGILTFRGIISKAALTDGPGSSTITWTAASHWADFNRVQGRRTEDTSHRAVNADGLPDREAAVREAYADDLGFAHATTSVNLTAVYQKTETRVEVDVDKNWYGGVSDVDTKEVEYDVPTELDLKFNLQAKYLPVVYGVQRVDTIPFFVDTRNHESTEVHSCYAIAEGPITGLYDIHLNGNSSICADESDFDVRGTNVAASDSDGRTDFLCKGYQNRGNTLRGYNAVENQPVLVTENNVGEIDWINPSKNAGVVPLTDSYSVPNYTLLSAPVGNTGILHGLSYSFDNPLKTDLTFHNGGGYQKANNDLVSIAQTTATTAGGVIKNFKVQKDYYVGKETYWGPNHRVLDTSYIHAKFKIDEGETDLPKFKMVVRGVAVKCYNYDNSYAKDKRAVYVSADPLNFELGDTVTLKKTSNNASLIGGNFTITDKWFVYGADGLPEYRFKVQDTAGTYPTIPANTHFYMEKGSHKWYMATHDAVVTLNQAVPAPLSNTVSARGNKQLTISGSSPVEAALSLDNPTVSLVSNANPSFASGNFAGFLYTAGSNIISNLGTSNWSNVGSSSITTVIVSNGIQLHSGASTTPNMYVGLTIELTRTLADGTTYVQTRKITDYHGSRVAIVDVPWDTGYIPGFGLETGETDTFTLFTGIDERASTNPAMQLLDYLTSERYGKGLKESDVDLPTFKSAAADCDQQSTVTVVANGSVTVANGARYRYGTAGSVSGYFRGTVESSVQRTIGGSPYTEITFTNVIGKLAKKWNKYTIWVADELIWNPATGELKEAQAGQQTNFTGNTISSLSLTKVYGSGAPGTIALDVTTFKAGNNNPVVKKYTTNFDTFSGSGYSLYDADDIKYWKYIGWDDNTQRHATRHQMNQSINTSQPLFTNVNKMLDQFNGMLRYSLGKYQLKIKAKAPSTFDVIEDIDAGDIIGNLKITDAGSKKTFNSANLSFPDPQNKFENRDISFFDSNFLKEDKGIPKNLSYQCRGITNYFNARFNIVQKLKESRYGLTVNFKIGPQGHALLPGEIIRITYPRFGWTTKSFRITSINYSPDCLATITADEHNNDAYVVDSTQESVDTLFTPGGIAIKPIPDSPTGLATSAPSAGGIGLTWIHSASYRPTTHFLEVWRSDTNSRSISQAITTNSAPNSNAAYTDVVVSSNTGIAVGQLVKYRNSPTNLVVQAINGTTITLSAPVEIVDETVLLFFVAQKIATLGDEVEYIDTILSSATSVDRYYWVRYAVRVQEAGTGAVKIKESFSPFHPTSATGGVVGTNQPAGSPRTLTIFSGANGQSGNFIQYDVNSINPNPNAVTLTAVPGNVAGTQSYVWTVAVPGGSFSAVPSAGNNATQAFSLPTNLSDLPKIIRCVMTDTVGTTEYTAEATLEFYGTRVVADGEDGEDGAVSAQLVDRFMRSRTAAVGDITFSTLNNAVKLVDAGGIDNEIAMVLPAKTVIAGQKYDVSFAYKADSAASAGFYARINADTNVLSSGNTAVASGGFHETGVKDVTNTSSAVPGFLNGSVLSNAAVSTEWQVRTFVYTVPTDAVVASLQFLRWSGMGGDGVTAGSATNALYIKDVEFSLQGEAGDNGDDGDDGFTLSSRLPAFTFSAPANGNIADLTGYSGFFDLKKGTTAFTYDNTVAYATNSWRYGTFSSSTTGGVGDLNITVAANGQLSINSNSPFTTGTSILDAYFDVQILDNNNSGAVLSTMRTSFTKAISGTVGADATTVSLRASQQIIEYAADGTGGTGTITLTATSQGFTDAYFKFTGGGSDFTDETSWTDGSAANNDTATFTVPTSYNATPYTFAVQAREGETGTPIAADTLTIASVKPGTNGNPGESFKTVSVYKIGDSTLGFSSGGASGQTFASPVNNLETGWSTTQPSITANNQIVYQATRTFSTITANSDAAWSTPVIVARRTDGTSTTGQSVKTVSLFREGSNSDAPTTAGTFADPDNQVNVNWLDNQPALANDGDVVYQITRTFTSDAAAPQDSAWSTPVIVASRTDGAPGAPGADALTVLLTNETHAIPASSSGTVSSFAGSGTSIKVYEGATQLDYDGVGTSDGHFKVNVAHSGMNTPAFASDDASTLHATVQDFTAMSGNTGSATYTIVGKFSDGTAIPAGVLKTQTFTKAKAGADSTVAGVRGSGIFTFEEQNTAQINNTYATSWAGTLNTTSAKAVAAAVIAAASDGAIRPNDRITVTDIDANLAGTRVYNGGVQSSTGSIVAGNFSSLVVETFPGSVIVDGTLSADKINGGTISGNNVNVRSNLVIGASNAAGAIYSHGKSSATSATNGFYLGSNSSGATVFAIGGGGSTSGGTTMTEDGIRVRDDTGAIRVKIGDLSQL